MFLCLSFMSDSDITALFSVFRFWGGPTSFDLWNHKQFWMCLVKKKKKSASFNFSHLNVSIQLTKLPPLNCKFCQMVVGRPRLVLKWRIVSFIGRKEIREVVTISRSRHKTILQWMYCLIGEVSILIGTELLWSITKTQSELGGQLRNLKPLAHTVHCTLRMDFTVKCETSSVQLLKTIYKKYVPYLRI